MNLQFTVVVPSTMTFLPFSSTDLGHPAIACMALATDLKTDLFVVEERMNLGQIFLRLTVVVLMSISVLAPVIRFGSNFWMKIDQLLLPLVGLIYLWLLLIGMARPIRSNWLFLVGPVFCICIALSTIYGTQVIGHPLLLRDLFELVKPAFPVFFFTLAYEADLTEQTLRKLGSVMLLTTSLICLYAYAQWFNLGFTYYLQPFYSGGLHDEGGLAHYRRVFSTLSNPNFLAMFLTWVTGMFILAVILRVGSRFWNVVLLFAALVALTMTGSRYGIIDTFLVLLLVAVLPVPGEQSRRARRTFGIAFVPLILSAILVISQTNKATLERYLQLRNPLQENSLRARLDSLWLDALDEIRESPVLGHGPAKIIFSNVYTDSEYLQILKQYGFLGLIPYLCYFFVPLGMVWRGFRYLPRTGRCVEEKLPATYWAMCAAFIMIVTSLFMNVGMSTYYNLSLVAFLWMWMGIGASCAKRIVMIADTSWYLS